MAEKPTFDELDKLGSLEELVTLKESLSRDLKDLDDEWGVRSMPADVGAVFADKTEMVAEITRRIDEKNARLAILQRVASDERHTERPIAAPNFIVRKTEADIYDARVLQGIGFSTVEQRDQTIKDYALRSIDTSHLPKSANVAELTNLVEYRDEGEEGKGEVARRILATGSPSYRSAFTKYLRFGNSQAFTPEENRAAALAVVGTTTTGGYAVPYIFDPTIIHIGAFTAQNPYRQACRVETISNGNNWRAVTVGAVTTAYVAEPTAATEQGPTFAQPTYTVQRAHSFATVSFETLQDRPDIGEALTGVFAESKATYEENQFTLGVGTTVFPQGMFLVTAYTVVATATNDVTAIADTQLVEAALPLRFRANGQWFMNRSTMRQLMALDTTFRYFSGQGIYYPGQLNPSQPPGQGNTGLALLGYPIWEVPSAVSTLTTDQAVIAVLADPKTFVIVDRIGMNIEVIPNMLNGATPSFPTGERGIYCFWRNTARPLLADGGRQLKVQ